MIPGLGWGMACAPPEVHEIGVGTLNLEYGGEGVDFTAVIEAIAALDADVVGLEEAWGNTGEVARQLGWGWYDPRTQVVSRLPLLQLPDGALLVELAPGQVVGFANLHLPSESYGPSAAARGATAASILATETRVRVPALEAAVASLAEGPAFAVGDLNSPSHLDWVDATVGDRPQIRFPLAWPVTTRAEALGFRDLYRAAHPDPERDPGLTWPADRPEIPGAWNPAPGAPADRIDAVWARGAGEVLEARVVGEGDVVPWPTDHRGVSARVAVRPRVPPALVCPRLRRVDRRDRVEVGVHGPADAVVQGVDDRGRLVASVATGAVDAWVQLPALGVGRYDLTLVADGEALAASEVWVVDPEAGPALGLGPGPTVWWSDAPGNRWDWVAAVRAGATEPAWWAYTGATIDGSAPLPVGPGAWDLYLLEDDGDAVLATVSVTLP